jgi:cation:H+ antiporter
MLWLISRYKRRETWKAEPQPDHAPAEVEGKPDTLRRAVLLTAAMGGIILVGGWLLASIGDALATQTGLGESFVGMTLVGTATSLPEISTVVMAVRIRRYTMAFADIFSTNIIDLMLVFVIDAIAPGQPVLDTQDNFAAFGALLAVVVTLIYLAGLVERRDRTWLRLGPDSWLVVAAYLGGVAVLYFLK